MKLAWLIPLVVAALIAGCGGSSQGGLSDALSFVPADSPIVITVKTDTASGQYKNIRSLLSRFPGGSQLVMSALSSRGGVNFNRDVKPILGNDLVVAPTGLRAARNDVLVALKVNDEAKARSLLQRSGTKSGDVYRTSSGEAATIHDGVLVVAPSTASLNQALARAGGSDHMTSSEFNGRLGGLRSDALVKVGGDLQALISQSAGGGTARRIPWVNALQTFGATVAADGDGIAIDFNVKTDPAGVKPTDVPLASGSSSPPVVSRPGEIGVGVRGLNQTIAFVEAAAQAINPGSLGRLNSSFQRIAGRYGVDVNRDVFGQLTGNTAFSVALGGGFAMRADVQNPAAFRQTLSKLSPALTQFAAGAGLRNASLVKPGHGNPFYALAGSNGKRYVFGVVGNVFVLATDSARAAQFAAESPAQVPGANGALAILADSRSLVAEALKSSKQAGLASLFTAPLGQLTGSVSSSTSGLTGHLKLNVH